MNNINFLSDPSVLFLKIRLRIETQQPAPNCQFLVPVGAPRLSIGDRERPMDSSSSSWSLAAMAWFTLELENSIVALRRRGLSSKEILSLLWEFLSTQISYSLYAMFVPWYDIAPIRVALVIDSFRCFLFLTPNADLTLDLIIVLSVSLFPFVWFVGNLLQVLVSSCLDVILYNGYWLGVAKLEEINLIWIWLNLSSKRRGRTLIYNLVTS